MRWLIVMLVLSLTAPVFASLRDDCLSAAAIKSAACKIGAKAGEPTKPPRPEEPIPDCGEPPTLLPRSSFPDNDAYLLAVARYNAADLEYQKCRSRFTVAHYAYMQALEAYLSTTLPAYDGELARWKTVVAQKTAKCESDYSSDIADCPEE